MSTAAVKTPSEGKQKPGHSPATTALHVKQDDGHIVGIGNLRVVIVQDGEFWFAQGLEIDYAAQGDSVEDVRHQFEEGLCCTIHEHLNTYGKLDNFLKPAPISAWKELLYDKLADVNRYSQISWHEEIVAKPVSNLPFEGIQYMQQQKAA